MLPYGFCTLAQLKSRLGVTDSKDDAVIQEIINGAAGAMEAVAGRTLRRDHYRTEVFNGGESLIRLGMSHVAKVHSVRESVTRDFETAGEYEELVEGTDWVLEDSVRGTGRLAGETGLLRRLNGRWERGSGTVRVVYTGGFKTDEESEQQSGSQTISGSAVVGYAVSPGGEGYVEADGYDNEWLLTMSPAGSISAVFCFPVAGLSPSVRLIDFGIYFTSMVQGPWSVRAQIRHLRQDPRVVMPADLYDEIPTARILTQAPGGDFINVAWDWTYLPKILTLNTTLNPGQDHPALEQALSESGASSGGAYLAFCVVCELADAAAPPGSSGGLQTYNSCAENPIQRPTLRLGYRPAFFDPFSIPDDLRHANLLQAVHEYQTRKSPGMISQYARGAASATGGGYMKTANMLLPEVAAAAARYRRII